MIGEMIRAAFVGCVLLLPFQTAAQARPDTRSMTCQQAAQLVLRAGAVVMTTGPGTYERIVANERFCLIGESAERALATTRDAAQCVIGYYCGQSTRWTLD